MSNPMFFGVFASEEEKEAVRAYLRALAAFIADKPDDQDEADAEWDRITDELWDTIPSRLDELVNEIVELVFADYL